MRFWAAGWRAPLLVFCVCLAADLCLAQDLTPRAYLVTPIHSNAVILADTFNHGSIVFDPTLPITDASGSIHIPYLSLYHSFSFLGRSANFAATLPYAVGNFQGNVSGTPTSVYRSGLMDSFYRLSVNLKGGPAMTFEEFSKWKQKTIVGASIRMLVPSGQYDPTKLVTPGANRWAFKPEIGVSRRWGNWVLDGYGGVWFHTTNSEFFSRNQTYPGVNTLSQGPVGVVETHVSYAWKPRLWASFDANYWYGGIRSLNGVENSNTLQANSRVGATASVPLNKHQSLKFSYSYGAVVRVGGNYHSVAAGWQYSWIGRPN
jgi:hypothetical protein